MNTKSQLTVYLQRLAERGYFHGAALVVQRGNVLLAKGYGLANHEHDVPNTEQTKFRIGSITKPITAMTLLRLQERGLLHVDDPIATYLPDYPQGDKITLLHLLSHTSGIPSYTSTLDYWWQTMRLPKTLEELVTLFKDLPLEFTPGTQFAYSNSGYVLLTMILEKVSGLSYADLVQREVCQPLQMRNTGYDDGRKLLKNRATGYTIQGDFCHTDWIDMSVTQGAYGLYTTVEDLLLLDQALYEEDFLSTATREQMWTPIREDYSLGWALDEVNVAGEQRKIWHHYGDINGFCGDWLRLADEELSVIVLSNFNLTPVWKIGLDLVKIALGEQVEVLEPITPLPLSPEEMKRCVGVYENPEHPERPYVITEHEGALFLEMSRNYGVRYRLPIQAVGKRKDALHFVTGAVAERVELHFQGQGYEAFLQYADVRGQQLTAQKIDTPKSLRSLRSLKSLK